jgi:hypothetical protein
MAIRFKSSASPKSRDALLWIIVGVLVIWGAWQAVRVRQQVLKALHPPHASATVATTTSAAPSQSTAPVDADNNTAMDSQLLQTAITDSGNLAPAPPEVIRVLAPGLLAHTRGQITLAQQELRNGHLLTARHTLQAALRRITGFGEAQANHIRTLLSQINLHCILGSAIVPGDPLVKLISVQRGNTLDYLAGLYRITPQMILHLNPGLAPQSLIPGTGIKVILGPMDAHFILHASRVDVLIRRHFIVSYPFRLATPIEPAAGRYHVVNYIPGPLGLDEWKLQAVNGQSRLIIAGGAISDADILMSPHAITTLHRIINPDFSRIDVEP